MSRGYNFCKINEKITQSFIHRRDMTYKYHINQPMSMCERKVNMNFAANTQLINSLDRSKSLPLLRK